VFVIGVTGGIGSGKTAATDHFASLGIEVVDADLASRTIVETGKPALAEIAKHYGDAILNVDGTLNRAELRQRIFADSDERRWLEGLTHPLIRKEIQQGLSAARSPYVILSSPLLIESGQSQLCSRILLIDVSETLQLSRTVARDNNSKEQVAAIIAAQASRTQRLEKADDVIVNDQSLVELHSNIEQLHKNYLKLAN
jgi:dephospho-CoA kinase